MFYAGWKQDWNPCMLLGGQLLLLLSLCCCTSVTAVLVHTLNHLHRIFKMTTVHAICIKLAFSHWLHWWWQQKKDTNRHMYVVYLTHFGLLIPCWDDKPKRQRLQLPDNMFIFRLILNWSKTKNVHGYDFHDDISFKLNSTLYCFYIYSPYTSRRFIWTTYSVISLIVVLKWRKMLWLLFYFP